MLKQTDIKNNVEWAIGGHRIVLQMQGLWVYKNSNLWVKTKMNIRTFFLLFCVLVLVTFPQTSALFKIGGNIDLIGDNMMANLSVTIAGMKLLKVWFKKEVVVALIEKMEEDWYQLKNENERKVMIKYAKIPRIMMVYGLINIYVSTFVFHAATIFFGIKFRLKSENTDTNDDYFLPLQSYYFFNVTTPFCYYSIIWTQFFGSLVAGFVYTSFDVLFGLFVLHACAQLENLAKRIQSISTRSHLIFTRDLKLVVSQHRRLISFINRVEGLFSTALLGIVISFGGLFSTLGFQIVTSLTDDSVDLPIFQTGFYVSYMNYFLCLMFIFSWVGEILITKNKTLTTTLYCCDWMNLSSNDRNLILFFLMRIQKNTCITIGGIIPLSFDSFTRLIKTSAGYISGLLAVKNR